VVWPPLLLRFGSGSNPGEANKFNKFLFILAEKVKRNKNLADKGIELATY
jgi:hypothetical protein